MIISIAYFQILGYPLIMWFGVITFLLFLLTASVSILNKKGITFIPFKWHPRFAILAIIFSVIHAVLGILINL